MKKIAISLSDGSSLEVDVPELVRRISWLSGARVIPPEALINLALTEGNMKWDHWRIATWSPTKASARDYAEISKSLLDDHGFCEVPKAEKIDDRQTWEAFQLHVFTKKPMRAIKKALQRLELIQKLQEIAAQYRERDIQEYLLLRYAETSSILER
jgi:hypothetical protein